MGFIAYDPILGEVKLTEADPSGPGPVNLVAGTGSGRMSAYLETLRGYDAALGGGEFIYAKAPAATVVGGVYELTPTLTNGVVVMTVTPWAGTANTGQPLAVGISALAAGQWGWFQVGGNAVVNVSGAPVAGNPVYWQAAGVVSPTAVAGKQVLGAKFATAPAVTLGQGSNAVALPATQAVVTLNRPVSQGAIT